MPAVSSPQIPSRVFIGLGSNLGDSTAKLAEAIAWLSCHPQIELLRHTETIHTAPWGVVDQPDFVNAVAEVSTELAPLMLLDELQRAEAELGREPGPRWGPRVIDLDILLYGDEVVQVEVLQIPHPRLTQRRFVVEQLLELDPGLRLPPSGAFLHQFL